MRQPFALLPILLLGACSLISPYTITFTNAALEVVDPETSTLDFVVSAPTLAYISAVSCENSAPLELYPVKEANAVATTVHKLPLTLLKDQPEGVVCNITVTAYDNTTTEQSSSSISLTLAGTAALPLAQEGEMCGGIAAFQCAEGLSCEIPDATIPDASGTCVKTALQTEVEVTEPASTTEVTPVDSGTEPESADTSATEAPVIETPVTDTPMTETTPQS